MEDNNPKRLLAGTNNDFGLKLWNKLANGKQENVFISPYSITSALALASAGATTTPNAAATTFWSRLFMPTPVSVRDEMRKVLHHDVISKNEEAVLAAETATIEDLDRVDDIEILIGNSVWAKADVKKEYLDVARSAFKAEVEPLTTVEAINKWVSEKTEGHIEELVSEIANDAVMLLLNAVYFKGIWTETFDKELTYEAPFKNSSGQEKPVAMMKMENDFFYHEVSDALQMIRLPYGTDGRFSASILLPPKSSSIDRLINAFDVNNWREWSYRSQISRCKGTLHLPRIKVEYGTRGLRQELLELGMKSAFMPGDQFNRIAPGVCISDVLHKAVVELDEEGTTASAATAVEMLKSVRVPTSQFEMVVDRPFVFVISDDSTGQILFVGRIENPQ